MARNNPIDPISEPALAIPQKQITGKLWPLLFSRPTSLCKLLPNPLNPIPEDEMLFFWMTSWYRVEPESAPKLYYTRLAIIEHTGKIQPQVTENVFALEDKAGLCMFTSSPSRLFSKTPIQVLIPPRQYVTNLTEFETLIVTQWEPEKFTPDNL